MGQIITTHPNPHTTPEKGDEEQNLKGKRKPDPQEIEGRSPRGVEGEAREESKAKPERSRRRSPRGVEG
ncbi:hypothetical protein AB0C69_32690, partial [Actinomadura sp. NPDC048032]|uniref:hypothetical protein n=1 Tax=Actinomadura sp. NPDC048032 TaxID=3155747 RepID=UPI003405CEA5